MSLFIYDFVQRVRCMIYIYNFIFNVNLNKYPKLKMWPRWNWFIEWRCTDTQYSIPNICTAAQWPAEGSSALIFFHNMLPSLQFFASVRCKKKIYIYMNSVVFLYNLGYIFTFYSPLEKTENIYIHIYTYLYKTLCR